MRLSKLTIERLAEMICGASGFTGGYEWGGFPYRSSSRLTQFFHAIDLEYSHDRSTRACWVQEVLSELNGHNASDPRLPSDTLVRVIEHLLDPIHFQDNGNHSKAVGEVSRVLARDELRVSFIDGQAAIEHVPSGVKAARLRPQTRPLSPAERKRKGELLVYLESATEDEFTEHVVVPLFQHLGYSRVKLKGHHEKTHEFGKDLWMKFALPSDHILYFGAQVKVERIHASTAGEPGRNIASVLLQLKMLFEHPVFDAVTNSKHLVDHAYLISSGSITEQARHLISEDLSRSMKRQVLFMDQDDIVRLWSLSSLALPVTQSASLLLTEDIPF